MAVGDFNGDGHLDLAVANSGGGNLTILIGNGHGALAFGSSPSAGTTPRSIVVGDFDRDWTLDLAVANSGSNNVTILIGTGSGSFRAPTSPVPASVA
jgi:hypothetical protein